MSHIKSHDKTVNPRAVAGHKRPGNDDRARALRQDAGALSGSGQSGASALAFGACGQTVIHLKKRKTDMRAMKAEKFSGYEGLKLVDLPKPAVSDGKVLPRMTAVGVTPLHHTTLSGQFPLA